VSAMHRLRLYHAVLALIVILAFFSPEWGRLHLWLGYGVGVMILVRLLLVLTGARQLGLSRFYPEFHGLKLDNMFAHPAISRVLLMSIAVTLVGATGTGIAMDGGRSFGLSQSPASAPASRSVEARDDADADEGEGEEEEEGPLGEAHELLGNLLMALVGAHVAYLIVFKRPVARFMLFVEPRKPAA
jgi:cytochrome b